MKIKFIKQEPKECGVACLAMVSGENIITCRHLLSSYGWELETGVTPVQILHSLYKLKFPFQYSCGANFINDTDLTKGIFIAGVPSLNSNNYHYIVIENGKVLDPQKGNEGVKIYKNLDEIIYI